MIHFKEALLFQKTVYMGFILYNFPIPNHQVSNLLSTGILMRVTEHES